MAERRDPRRPQSPIDRPAFHFDTGRRGDDHDDNFWDDFVDHEDSVPHFDDHGDGGDFWDGDHNDSAPSDPDRLFDRIRSLIESLEEQLLTRQRRLEHRVDERLSAVEREAGRVVHELGEHVLELGQRLDDAAGGGSRR